MELVNKTPFVVGCTVGTDKTGVDHLLAVAKATYNLPHDGASDLAAEQRPLVTADEFSGAPGYSAAVVESDYAMFKPRCDVLLTGTAYSPRSSPVSSVVVSLSVGAMQKSLRVTGFRQWEVGLLGGVAPGKPGFFTRNPFSYDTAFGGIDNFHADVWKHTSYFDNPVGVGYHKEVNRALVQKTPMPNTEALDEPVRAPDGKYAPMALGPVGRGWPKRLRYAGTYDAGWVENRFPFLPEDFDDRYFQAASPDQQIDYVRGGERVVLLRLTEEGYCSFQLPRMDLDSVVFYLRTGEYRIARFVVDTLHFFPDERVYTMTARASAPFSDDPQACSKVIFGRGSKAWVRALENGKTFVSRERKLRNCRATQDLVEMEEVE